MSITGWKRLDRESRGGLTRHDTKTMKLLYHDSEKFSNPTIITQLLSGRAVAGGQRFLDPLLFTSGEIG